VIDFVGADVTLTQAYSMGGRQSKFIIVDLAGGTLQFTAGLVNELEVTTSNWGSISELSEVLFLAKIRNVRTKVKKIRFDEMNKTFEALKAGKIESRAVLIPDKR
jgi:alcohol dehydrogenase, propanol-preferring